MTNSLANKEIGFRPFLFDVLKLFILIFWAAAPVAGWIFLEGTWAKVVQYMICILVIIHGLETLYNLIQAKQSGKPLFPWLIRTALFGGIAIYELKHESLLGEPIMKPIIPENVLRYACLLIAIGNVFGNLFLFLFYKPVFEWLNMPVPHNDSYLLWMTGFSFNMGILAYFIFRDPQRNIDMLKVGFVGKCIFAGLALAFYFNRGIEPLLLGAGIFDGFAALVFALYMVRLSVPK